MAEPHWRTGDVVVVRDPLETRGTRTYLPLADSEWGALLHRLNPGSKP